MKNLILITFGILLSHLIYGQSSEGCIKMYVDYPQNQELQDVLSFENIDYRILTFVSNSLNGKSFSIIAKEIWNGEIKNERVIIDSEKNNLPPLNSDTLKITVISKKFTEDQIKMEFKFPWLGITSTFNATKSNTYSLRTIGTNFNIVPNEKFYVLAYILPYQKDNYQMYCAVENSGFDVESWGKKFNLEHYIVFEMIFE